MERHSENALYIAQKLEQHPKLESIKYPFLKSHPQYGIASKQMKAGGGIVTFSVKGGLEAGIKFMDRLKMIKISPNLGDTRSIATHPASSTHCKLSEEDRLAVGIGPGLIRISIGLEHREDILNDIQQALDF
jgi:O-succinylhomoserine sulfhydrylase